MQPRKPSILVVEDSTMDYRELRADLFDLGFLPSKQVVSFEAFQCYQDNYDLAIIDIELDGKRGNRDGIKVVKALLNKVPVILHTIHGEARIYNQLILGEHITEIMKPGQIASWRTRINTMLIRFYGAEAASTFHLDMSSINSYRLEANRFPGFSIPKHVDNRKLVIPPNAISYLETRPQKRKGKVFFISDLGVHSRTDSLSRILENPLACSNLLQVKSNCLINFQRILSYSTNSVEISLNKQVHGRGSIVLSIGRTFQEEAQRFFRSFG